MIWPQSILFLLIFRALLKMKNDLKHTFISFSSFDNSEKGTPGVFFYLFSDFDNVKRLLSTCLFELVKLNELISTQYKFNPFLDWDRLFTKKEYLGQTWLKRFSQILFYTFSDLSDKFTKKYLWSFLSSSFSNSLNMKKGQAITVVRLVKT